MMEGNSPARAVIMVGRTYSGKTTFARHVASKLTNAVVLDSFIVDEFLRRSFSAFDLTRTARPSVTFDDQKLKDDIFFAVVEHALRHNTVPILANAHLDASRRQRMITRLRERGAEVTLIYFDHSDAFLLGRIRLASRNRSVKVKALPNRDEIMLAKQKDELQAPSPADADVFIHVTDASSLPSLQQQVIDVIVPKVTVAS